MAKFRKKPVVIEAIQFNGKNAEEIEQWSNNNVKRGLVSEDTLTKVYLEIETLEGTMTAQLNDYIIKGVSGEFYPCKPDIFEKTYDAETTSFKERLIKEHEELSDKLNKLYTFGSTEKFKELDPIHQQLLIIQSGSMATYNETLKLRLGLL